DLIEQPAGRALYEGMRAYDDGLYAQSEAALRRALALGLRSGRDRATADKLLAFITCTSQREAECAALFRAARAADPTFALSAAESGHPIWGPVYRAARH
ncbi:MAG: TssQ family T6SS-associated lipoprotein, partial [Burkholderiales bacterium]|nr:TssQ family T6SS-associated lipoprotein [Burkholderiales bacterium]